MVAARRDGGIPVVLSGDVRLCSVGAARLVESSAHGGRHFLDGIAQAVPRNDADTEDASHTAKDQGDNSTGSKARENGQKGIPSSEEAEICLPVGQGVGWRVLAAEVKEVDGVTRSIASGGHAALLAGGEVVLGDGGELLLQLGGCLDKGRQQAGDDVPLDVAVEEPDA